MAAAFPLSVSAHKVSAVSVVTEINTGEQTFKVELAMDVDPTGDPAIDDVITPEQAATTFATEALKLHFDDATLDAIEPEIRVITESDEQTPAELQRKKVVATMRGKIPEGTENFLMYVAETTEAAVVMLVIKDKVPGRRLQVLYPGEFSNPVNLKPEPGSAPPAAAKPSENGEPAEKSAGTGEPEPSNFLMWIGLGAVCVIGVVIVIVRVVSSASENE
jgi:hypothetical protein